MREWQKDRILYNLTKNQKEYLHQRFIKKFFNDNELEKYKQELLDSPIYQELISKRTPDDLSFKGTPYMLYAIVRKTKPTLTIETGVDHGFSSTVILDALQHNNHGELISIDLNLHPEFCGSYVPNSLKNRWVFLKGKTSDILPTIDKDINLFFHDSDHKYENQFFEYNWAWEHMKSKGVITSHDIGASNAFFNFAMIKNIDYYTIKTTGNMYRFGVIVKNR